ncbi:hypothetical protein D0T50_11375 [Bacteroides sp. 214]|uniref:hypothetical protein n=1 Tax=Bacteroides sp. 214 TaxID=2302935 RepID=UPI0013D406DC|nr:hypothetical protein [Bacteroides sp. 214]NDW13489.1 hypothetical protein [Bacteroides sp. 214]
MENQEYPTRNQSLMTVGDWLITLILIAIPLVGIIMLLVWAFSSSTPVSKANFAKASLILMVVGFILIFIFYGALAALFVAGIN